MRIAAMAMIFALSGCAEGKPEFTDCSSEQIADVNKVLQRGAELVDPRIADVGRRLHVKCVPREQICEMQKCWCGEDPYVIENTDGCTKWIGTDKGEYIRDMPNMAQVVATQDISVALLLGNEFQHWFNKDKDKCRHHTPDCWDHQLTEEINKGIR